MICLIIMCRLKSLVVMSFLLMHVTISMGHGLQIFSDSSAPPQPQSIMEVPTATSLRDIYTEDTLDTQTKRWEKLLADFKAEYGQQADFVSRSPGRVNLIGEVSSAQPLRFFAFHGYCCPIIWDDI